MPDSNVVLALREYRAALDANEAGLMDDLARRWLGFERNLESDMIALANEIASRVQAGKPITEQIIWRMESYKSLHAQMEDQIALYNFDAEQIVSKAQEINGMLGLQAANDAIAMTYLDTGVIGNWNRLNIDAIKTMIGFAGNGSPLHKLLKADYPDAVDGLMKVLTSGVVRGYGPAQIAREMSNGAAMGLERSLLIARTEIARTYRMANTEQYRKSGVVSGFKRLVKKETACMACLIMDGQLFRIEEELEDHPRGKCVPVPVVDGTREATWQSGVEYFRSLSPEEQSSRMGADKYTAWKEGLFGLYDLARISHSDEWGDSPRVATLKELSG